MEIQKELNIKELARVEDKGIVLEKGSLSACMRFSVLAGAWIQNHNDERPFSQVMRDAGLGVAEERLEWIRDNCMKIDIGWPDIKMAANEALEALQG